MTGLIVGMIVIMWVIPLLASKLGGWDADATFALIMPLMLVWFAIGAIGSFAIACPRCGRSVFKRALMMSVPWAARTCSKCGHDLTVEGRAERKA